MYVYCCKFFSIVTVSVINTQKHPSWTSPRYSIIIIAGTVFLVVTFKHDGSELGESKILDGIVESLRVAHGNQVNDWEILKL